MRGAPCRTFHGKDFDVVKASLTNFGSELLGLVKVRRGEIIRVVSWIAMLTGCEIIGNYFAKVRVLKESPRKAVD